MGTIRYIGLFIALACLYTGRASEVADTFIQEVSSGIDVYPHHRDRQPMYMALRNNAILDVAIVPNLSFEVAIAGRWSVSASWMHAWWSGGHKFWRIYGGEAEGRYWFGNAARRKPLTGHHIGVFGTLFTYDLKPGSVGVQSPTGTGGGGVSYGYSFPVAPRLNIDLNIGIGFLVGKYTKYEYKCGGYVCTGGHYLRYFRPVKAEVSIVWLFGYGNRNDMAGK